MYTFSIIAGFIPKTVDILLKKNNLWDSAQLIMNNRLIYNFIPNNNYYITHSRYNNLNTLLINDAMVYQHKHLFNYNINFILSEVYDLQTINSYIIKL